MTRTAMTPMMAAMTMAATTPLASVVAAAVEYDVVTLMKRHGTLLSERQRISVQHGDLWHCTFW
jgi:hypothetical protein